MKAILALAFFAILKVSANSPDDPFVGNITFEQVTSALAALKHLQANKITETVKAPDNDFEFTDNDYDKAKDVIVSFLTSGRDSDIFKRFSPAPADVSSAKFSLTQFAIQRLANSLPQNDQRTGHERAMNPRAMGEALVPKQLQVTIVGQNVQPLEENSN